MNKSQFALVMCQKFMKWVLGCFYSWLDSEKQKSQAGDALHYLGLVAPFSSCINSKYLNSCITYSTGKERKRLTKTRTRTFWIEELSWHIWSMHTRVPQLAAPAKPLIKLRPEIFTNSSINYGGVQITNKKKIRINVRSPLFIISLFH